MHVTVTTEDDAIVTVDVDPATVVENLKAILEAETDVPTREQVLLFNGGELANDDVLSAKNVGEGDLLMLLRKRGGGGGGVGAAANGANDNPTAMRPDGSAVDPAAFQRAIRADAHAMQSLRANNPSLHGAILNDDPSAMQQMLRDAATARKRAEDARQAEIDLLNADPFDLDAQRKIEEAIRQKNVDENFETAMETTPEAFGSVIMLYVDMEVNGHALKVFVDSGAQMTIMSLGCAIRLGLERLIDKVRSIQKFFTHRPVSTLDRVPFQLTDELFLYGMALRDGEASRRASGRRRSSGACTRPRSRSRGA